MESLKGKIACVTGASSGIGAACAVEFAKQGCALLLMARREERTNALARQLESQFHSRTHCVRLDVRQQPRVEQAFGSLPEEWKGISILVNNAGLARGFSKIHEGDLQDWEEMIDTNIKGLLYVTRVVLPGMVKRNEGHIINIGSIAGHQLYPNGNVYCATKYAVDALSQGLRMDLLGTAVRVSNVEPGLVQTEFSDVRFHGDTQRASQVYHGMTPLRPEDIAEIAVFCATRPPHVDVSDVIVMPTAQASVSHVHRSP